MRQTQFSLAAEPTQQRILALAIAMKPFGKNALKLNGSVTVAVPRRLHVTYYEASMGIYMGKVGETVKHPATWVKIAKANLQATGCAGGSSYCSRDQRVSVCAGGQIESEDSRSCGSTTLPSAIAAFAPAGNCSTVARWPSHKRVTSTTCPSGNSSAS